MKSLKEMITGMSEGTKAVALTVLVVGGLTLFPLFVPNEYKFPTNTNGAPAGWKWPTKEDDKKLYESIELQRKNIPLIIENPRKQSKRKSGYMSERCIYEF